MFRLSSDRVGHTDHQSRCSKSREILIKSLALLIIGCEENKSVLTGKASVVINNQVAYQHQTHRMTKFDNWNQGITSKQ